MPEINVSRTSQVALAHQVIGETILFLDAYGNIGQANQYFDNRMNSSVWLDAELDDKKAAMLEATRLIDRLNFNGSKTSSEQLHEFPRNAEVTVPKNIELACYEISIKLLEGWNPDYEVENLSAESRGYGGARTTYNRTFAQEHISAGIPSVRAWTWLKPYLRDPGSILLSRVT